jgi:hypothetical protein
MLKYFKRAPTHDDGTFTTDRFGGYSDDHFLQAFRKFLGITKKRDQTK